MQLIDKSFFIGEITIPNLDTEGVGERLDWFINKYQKRFLILLLGKRLYDEFWAAISGIAPEPGPVLSKNERIPFDWNVDPVTFIDMTINNRSRLGNDPHIEVWTVDGNESEIMIPNFGIGKTTMNGKLTNMQIDIDLSFSDVKTGYILLYTSDYIIDATDPLNPVPVNPDQKWIDLADYLVDTTLKQSPITNYVYWFWMYDNASQSTGVGEVLPSAENSTPVSNLQKMIRAWNEMCDFVHGSKGWFKAYYAANDFDFKEYFFNMYCYHSYKDEFAYKNSLGI